MSSHSSKNKLWQKIILIITLTGILNLITACSLQQSDAESSPPAQTSKDLASMSIDEQTDYIVSKMSNAEKVGQLMMIGIQGNKVDDDSLYMLHEYHIGGIVLFDRNMQNKAQVKQLTTDLQQQAQQKVPLFIGVDEEGGEVARMKHDLAAPLAQSEIGASNDVQQAFNSASSIAKQLNSIGINLNFAPVADVGSNDTRSFSTNPQTVSDFVISAAHGYEQENMLYTLKHFPGIGKGKVDTHIDSYSVASDLATLQNEDLLPFKTAIDTLSPQNYMIMVSHLTYPAINSSDKPASLSAKIITDLLRNELHYQGIIITDDMEMGAISKYYDFSEVGVKAIMAGADIVMVCHEYEHEIAVYNGLLTAVNNKTISQQRLDDSVRRIVKVKLLHKL